MNVTERYLLGLKVDNTPIPDPSEFKYTEAGLDIFAERDVNGLLVRDMVATKHNLGLKWDALSWSTIQSVLALTRGESFSFTYPSPDTGQMRTGTYYAGDREFDAIMLAGDPSEWFGSLSFNLIEF